jgi:hypothetical protein
MRTGALQIWDARAPADHERWRTVHRAWPDREVFAHPSYVGLLARRDERPLCAFMETPRGGVMYPLIQRPLPGTAAHTDLTTPYGYGGPFATGDAPEHAVAFWRQFDAWARSERVVSEFVRLALFPEGLLPHPGEREQKQLNVVRSLDLSEDRLWRDVDHKVRKNVARARREGVTIEVDQAGTSIADFARIYGATMDRRGGRADLYFSEAFFEAVRSRLAGHFVFFHARLAGRIVSSELVLVSAATVYSFLGGTDREAFVVRPNDLLKYEAMLWAKRAGKRRYVLGGGVAPGDGVFRYKRAFAPGGLVPFCVARRVHDTALYADLAGTRRRCGERLDPAWSPDPGYFPAYRAQLPRPAARDR